MDKRVEEMNESLTKFVAWFESKGNQVFAYDPKKEVKIILKNGTAVQSNPDELTANGELSKAELRNVQVINKYQRILSVIDK